MKNIDERVTEEFWSDRWEKSILPKNISLNGFRPSVGYYLEFNRIWQNYLPRNKTIGQIEFLEIGCAKSVWLPFFAKEFGYKISGIDYSLIGCKHAETILNKAGTKGNIYHQNLFYPLEFQKNNYDIVFSEGVIEHFEDPKAAIKAISAYARQGGLIVTIIPHYTRWLGKLKGLCNKKSLENHVLITKNELENYHKDIGIKKIYCGYHIFMNPNCIHASEQWNYLIKITFNALIKVMNIGVGLIWRFFPGRFLNINTASYIVYIGVN